MTTNVLQLLEESARRFPDKTALREVERTLSYSKLCELSRRTGSALAGRDLRRKAVGVYAEKGIDALCGFFGAVYAGAFYTMLNTELPDARLRSIQSVLEAPVILTTSDLAGRAREIFPGTEILIISDLAAHDIDEGALNAARRGAIDTDPLYVNFTSGSTGVPKGIAVCHRSVLDFIGFFTELFGITDSDVIANQAPFDFNVSVKDIYSAIATGAELVIVPREYFSAPTKLIDWLCDSKVTTMIWAVSALCLITTFHGLDYKTPETVSKILFSGEVMPVKHLREWQKHLPEAMYVNLYGPTEITCNCTYHILEPGRDYSAGIPTGVPFPNEDVFLLGENNQRITEPGQTGIITVRGTALALGYYKNDAQNAGAFIQNPLNTAYPETVYLTGDLGMYSEDGELMFCGRADNQIKYQGHRIELEEIERAMSAVKGVERCFCLFDEKKSRLRGYYVGEAEKADIVSEMSASVPPFMIPGTIYKLDNMILTKNGKIDRAATAATAGGKSRGTGN